MCRQIIRLLSIVILVGWTHPSPCCQRTSRLSPPLLCPTPDPGAVSMSSVSMILQKYESTILNNYVAHFSVNIHKLYCTIPFSAICSCKHAIDQKWRYTRSLSWLLFNRHIVIPRMSSLYPSWHHTSSMVVCRSRHIVHLYWCTLTSIQFPVPSSSRTILSKMKGNY